MYIRNKSLLYAQHITLFRFCIRIFRRMSRGKKLWAANFLGLPMRYEARIQFWINSENTPLQSNNNCYLMHFLCLKLAWYRNYPFKCRLLFPHDSHQDHFCQTCTAHFQPHGVSHTIPQFSWLQGHTGEGRDSSGGIVTRTRDEQSRHQGSISGSGKETFISYLSLAANFP